jgi:hypothetical protein
MGKETCSIADSISSTTPKPFVFVVMPFDSAFDDIYEIAIKEACDYAGAYCERLDDQIFEERMLDRIYNQIAKADILIADMSNRNPNVFYEVGYAHALGKRVILLTNNAEDIPFDLNQHFHIVYNGSISNLRTNLGQRLKWYIENPSYSKVDQLSDLEFYLDGKPIFEGLEIELEYDSMSEKIGSMGGKIRIPISQSYDFVFLQFSVHNSIQHNMNTVQFRPLLFSDEIFKRSINKVNKTIEFSNAIKLPNGKLVHERECCSLEPGGWKSFDIKLDIDEVMHDTKFYFTLQIVYEGPPIEYNFTIKIPPEAIEEDK